MPSCRYITLQPTKRAPWSAIALIVRSSFDARRREAGDDRRHQHAGVDAGVDQLAHGAQPLQRVRGARLERSARRPRRRSARSCRPCSRRRGVSSSSTSRVAHDHRPLGDQADRRSRACQAPRSRGASACSALRSAGRNRWRCRPRRAPASTTADRARAPAPRRSCVFTRITDANSSSGVHLELHVVAAGEAVVAAVGAAAVRVERPVERHALDAVERRAAGDLLVARLRRRGARLRSAPRCRRVFTVIGDVAGGRFAGRRGRRGGDMTSSCSPIPMIRRICRLRVIASYRSVLRQ